MNLLIRTYIAFILLLLFVSCHSSVEVKMKGDVNHFEEWEYKGEYIIPEARSMNNIIPDSLRCCGNKFVLHGHFRGSKKYEFNYEFLVDRRIYLYDSFYIDKPYKAVRYDTAQQKSIYNIYSAKEGNGPQK